FSQFLGRWGCGPRLSLGVRRRSAMTVVFPYLFLPAREMVRGGSTMTFEEILAQVVKVLQREGRISYRALQRRFDLDDAYLEDVKIELIEAKQLASDENGRILVWAEQDATTAPLTTAQEEPPNSLPEVQRPQEAPSHIATRVPEAERRQLTVLFCD